MRKYGVMICGLGIFAAIFAAFPARAQTAEDPCPAPMFSQESAPDDLTKVQADIDRYTLCIERAELLQRLNKLTSENSQTALGVTPLNPGMMLEKGHRGQASAPPPSPAPSETAAPANPGGQEGGWSIVEIFGGADDLRARLREGKEGGFLRVRAGDSLPDGSKVAKITPTRVILANGGKAIELEWLE